MVEREKITSTLQRTCRGLLQETWTRYSERWRCAYNMFVTLQVLLCLSGWNYAPNAHSQHNLRVSNFRRTKYITRPHSSHHAHLTILISPCSPHHAYLTMLISPYSPHHAHLTMLSSPRSSHLAHLTMLTSPHSPHLTHLTMLT